MPLPKAQAWFPAKTYGYGWGIPTKWQGWAVMTGFVVILIAGSFFFAAPHLAWFLGLAVLDAAALTGFCYWKGEKPGWRWGGESERRRPDDDKPA